jgi:hypothetical protein
MTRDELLDRLSKLLPSQFEQVLYRAQIPQEHLSGATAPLGLRAVEVMRYVEQQNQLDRLAGIVELVVNGGGGQAIRTRMRTSPPMPATGTLPKARAIWLLHDLARRLKNFAGRTYTDENFRSWHADCATALRNIFGQDSPHVAEFNKVSFSPTACVSGRWLPDERTAMHEGVQRGVALLEAGVTEIETFWPDDTPVAGGPDVSAPMRPNQSDSSETKGFGLSVRTLTPAGDLWVFDFQEMHELSRGDRRMTWISRGEGPQGASHFAEWSISGKLSLSRAAEGRPLGESDIPATYVRALRDNIDAILAVPEASIIFTTKLSARFDAPPRASHPRDAILWELEHLALMIPLYVRVLQHSASRSGTEHIQFSIPEEWHTHGPLFSFDLEVKEFYEAYVLATPLKNYKHEAPITIANLKKAESLALRAIRSLKPAAWPELQILPVQR